MELSRRDLIAGLIGIGCGGLVIPRIVSGQLPAPDKAPFEADQRATLTAAMERLLPGALEAGVPQYIDNWLIQKSFIPLRNYLAHGTKHLEGVSRKKFKKQFTAIDGKQQDAVLKMFAQGKIKVGRFDGNIFFQQMMELVLEGFLADPKYGGNKGRMGWKYIGIPDGLRSCWWNPNGTKHILNPEDGFHD
jgi:hypothetical protein